MFELYTAPCSDSNEIYTSAYMIYSNTRFTWSFGISLCSCLQFEDWTTWRMWRMSQKAKILSVLWIAFISFLWFHWSVFFFFSSLSHSFCVISDLLLNNKLLRCCYCINQILLDVFYCDFLFAWFGLKQIVWKKKTQTEIPRPPPLGAGCHCLQLL